VLEVSKKKNLIHQAKLLKPHFQEGTNRYIALLMGTVRLKTVLQVPASDNNLIVWETEELRKRILLYKLTSAINQEMPMEAIMLSPKEMYKPVTLMEANL
jgi:hypothetical protein